MTDSQTLLAEYVQSGSDAAFRELVTRYVDLVYSTALRLVDGDRHRAEDVAQTVFVNLARTARALSGEVKLGGWLHRHTCFVAAKTMRGERRRQSRERQAVEMNALQDDSEANFSLVGPILDEAINELGEADRTAILLRFFEQQDFRSVGAAIGSNEDAARMRVTRALEKLQELLMRHGVTTSAGALSVALSTHVVQAAPVGLAVTISTAAALAGTTIVTTTTAAATKAIAMTTLQKTLITTAFVAAVGTGIYEVRQASILRTQVQALRQQQAVLSETAAQMAASKPLATLLTNASATRFNWESVESTDYKQYIANLRSVGCPEETIRDIIRADVNKLYEEKKREIRKAAPKFEYWKGEDFIRSGVGREAWIKMFAVNEERGATLRALGIEPDLTKKEAKNAMFMDWWLDYLGDEKKAQVLRLHRELEDRLAIRERGSLDMVQIQTLLKQQDEAVKRLLTPDEAFQYDLRQQTGTAGTVRRSLVGMEPTEQEFVAVFKIRKGFEEQHPDVFPEVQTVNPAELTAAGRRALRDTAKQVEGQIDEQIRLTLGSARYTDYEMAKNPIYQEMWLAARDADFGMAEAKQLFQARLSAEERAQRVKDDQGITPEQRDSALAGIRKETERTIQTVLREKGWDQFNRGSNKRWLDSIHPAASANTQ